MNGELASRWIPGVLIVVVGTYASLYRHPLAQQSEAFNKGLLGLNVRARQYEVALLIAGLAFICIGVATLAGFIRFG